MKENDVKPAKIIGKVDLKKDDKGISPAHNEPTKSSIEEPLGGTREVPQTASLPLRIIRIISKKPYRLQSRHRSP